MLVKSRDAFIAGGLTIILRQFHAALSCQMAFRSTMMMACDFGLCAVGNVTEPQFSNICGKDVLRAGRVGVRRRSVLMRTT